MRRFAVFLAVLLTASAPALAYDDASQAVIDRFKPGKLVPTADLAALMSGSERWCYNQRDNACGWSDIYLSVEHDMVSYELSNLWTDDVLISLTDTAEFRSDRYICETGNDWVPSVRATSLVDGAAIGGRELAALKTEIAAMIDTTQSSDCFDYLYGGHDEDARTVTLIQRQYIGGQYQPGNDAEVTLHFDKASADALFWY